MGTVGVNIHVFIQGGITLWSVKLNNPLMGTETISCTYCLNSSSGECVKLNNPLMGTETCFHFQMYLQCLVILVKLNNPLMGTETACKSWLFLHF